MNNDERRNDSQNGNHARRTYSLTEIAKHLDRPPTTVRTWRQQYAEYLESSAVGNGRNKRFKQQAFHLFELIAEMKDRNEPHELIQEALTENVDSIIHDVGEYEEENRPALMNEILNGYASVLGVMKEQDKKLDDQSELIRQQGEKIEEQAEKIEKLLKYAETQEQRQDEQQRQQDKKIEKLLDYAEQEEEEREQQRRDEEQRKAAAEVAASEENAASTEGADNNAEDDKTAGSNDERQQRPDEQQVQPEKPGFFARLFGIK
ncbi:conserved hypothetical protein (plasmid) [Halobacillus halophilus DSM 2266]|uniref:HTH merR-type domain-containing protein n=1 Tax=Halobacillus halophilus (strain ATCC 35676 / DSM 2266 / JCM 20832 / KCTC 3685 / LMG 17431 / NBRC 102448 / NCIMB 2269) TaxID=866895 RepID=I0JTP3_HALH3|nr:MerR family transcriptional regulator [Halobacillus halophilus]CCG47516.1 conserved hypothetical protein [Halobacillus halophilus DSM 2266]